MNSAPHENFSTSELLSVDGVCLDEETWTVLKLFAEFQMIRLRSNISEYLDRITDRVILPAPDICIIDFDRDRRKANKAAQDIHSAAPEIALFAISSDAQRDL